jgi:integrase
MLTELPVEDPTYLFPEQRKIHLDIARRALLPVQFSRICARLGIEGKSFHCLRHAFATQRYAKMDKEALARKLAATLSLDEIAALLGHSGNGTTRRYVHKE